jgi:crotonobetaine/carnitine-CoA ligase
MVDPPLLVPHMIRDRAEASDQVFVQDVDGPTLTHGQLHHQNLTWADAFRRLGVAPGDNVATMLPVNFESYSAWLGLGWLRAVEVPINTGYKGLMLQYLISNSRARVLVISDRYFGSLKDVANRLPDLETVVVPDAVPDPEGLPFRVISGDEFLCDARPATDLVGPAWDDIACIIYTSGTTGPSKGVLKPWSSLYFNNFGFPPDAIQEGGGYYSFYPQFHVSGKLALSLPLFKDARLVLREVFSVSHFWSDVHRFKCTMAMLVGSMSKLLLAQPESDADANNSLRWVNISPLYPEVSEFTRRFKVNVTSGFGMTEIGGPIRKNALENFRSCGKVRPGPPGYEVRIVDEHDRDVDPGVHGELIVRSKEEGAITPGYFGMPEKTEEAWRGGWFHTGDGFRNDEDGNFYFVDRVTDSMRRRGENISSFEVEAHVNEHPAVLESAAVPVPSELTEDDVKVCVVLHPGASMAPEELIDFLIPRMARFMIPRYVEITTDLPKTEATGRIKKHLLRENPLNDQTWDRESAGIVLPR